MNTYSVKVTAKNGRYFIERMNAETMQEAIGEARKKYPLGKYNLHFELESVESLPVCDFCDHPIIELHHSCYVPHDQMIE